jgi:hypothetical protein
MTRQPRRWVARLLRPALDMVVMTTDLDMMTRRVRDPSLNITFPYISFPFKHKRLILSICFFFTPSRYLGLDWLCICILLVEIISSKQQSAIEKESSSLGLFRRLDDIVHDSLIHVE